MHSKIKGGRCVKIAKYPEEIKYTVQSFGDESNNIDEKNWIFNLLVEDETIQSVLFKFINLNLKKLSII